MGCVGVSAGRRGVTDPGRGHDPGRFARILRPFQNRCDAVSLRWGAVAQTSVTVQTDDPFSAFLAAEKGGGATGRVRDLGVVIVGLQGVNEKVFLGGSISYETFP